MFENRPELTKEEAKKSIGRGGSAGGAKPCGFYGQLSESLQHS